MAEIEHEIEFEELTPILNGNRITGMMLYGKAILASADPSEPHAFYVKSIRIDGGLLLERNGGRPRGHEQGTSGELFDTLAHQIESDRTEIGRLAQAEFADAVDEARQPDPDAWYDARRDARMEGVWHA